MKKNALKRNEKLQEKLQEHFKPLLKNRSNVNNALKELKDKIANTNQKSFLKKLPKLIHALTSVTKKKKIRDKFHLTNRTGYYSRNDVEIGINCNGLGIVSYGCQLNPLVDEWQLTGGYSMNSDNFIVLMQILKDQDLCLDIADNILSRNRKDFLKLATAFQNLSFNLDNGYNEVSIDNETSVKFDTDGEINEIDIDEARIEKLMEYDGSDFGTFLNREKILPHDIMRFNLSKLIVYDELLDEKTDNIIHAIKKHIADKSSNEDKENKLDEVVSEIAITYEALENI